MEPPEELAYQSITVPDSTPVTLKIIIPDPQTLSSTATKLFVGIVFTFALTGILLELTHPVIVFLISA